MPDVTIPLSHDGIRRMVLDACAPLVETWDSDADKRAVLCQIADLLKPHIGHMTIADCWMLHRALDAIDDADGGAEPEADVLYHVRWALEAFIAGADATRIEDVRARIECFDSAAKTGWTDEHLQFIASLKCDIGMMASGFRGPVTCVTFSAFPPLRSDWRRWADEGGDDDAS
jgi:hypothetical protein